MRKPHIKETRTLIALLDLQIAERDAEIASLRQSLDTTREINQHLRLMIDGPVVTRKCNSKAKK